MADKTKERRVSVDVLQRFCIEALVRVGVPGDHARIVAESLVEANLRGVDSHGVILLPRYVKRIELGLMKPDVVPKVVRDTGAVAVMDGDNGLGQVIAIKAMEMSIGKAREYGIGAVGIRNSNHFGMAAYIAMQALGSDMIALVLSNAAPSIAPWGGTQPLLGTNPLAISVPTDRDPIVLDMALAVAARGRIRSAAREGKSIPEGWAFDEHGKPTTDAEQALKGSVFPIAGPKGYALALMVDVLSGVLTGSFFADSISSVHDTGVGTHVGHFIEAIRIESFMPVREFKARMAEMRQKIRGCPLTEGVDKIYLPGEIEFDQEKERKKLGIPLTAPVWRQLVALAEELGFERDLAKGLAIID